MYANAGPNDVVVRDEAYASQLFHQAAELGYKFSQFRLGSAYEYGLMGCPVDFRQSIIWYTHAAAQGEHQSELALSGWYLTGAEGILQQSDTEAYLWARNCPPVPSLRIVQVGSYTDTDFGEISHRVFCFGEAGSRSLARPEIGYRSRYRCSCQLGRCEEMVLAGSW
jgi:hypothetical protein